ncbi:tetratricopeptide repeat protein [Aurantimonas endophytica]|uniref:Alkylhydroperoxidase family enzyme n=1 Tax=Aurantimonas endophytica TaxID=1522175 RepID=A0A7W6HGN5_9HYPH|nr:hypothetical protein [Aurantimonas endophytica]MBB4004838.1 alkylhydroperoxidase family enzyme [Aurantimonas endophytica]MCO6405648.1 hypothetical protein [Aurantimonas endophytica]
MAALNDARSDKSAADIAEDLQFVVRYAPIDPRAGSLLGELALRQGEVEQATALFRRVLAQSPTELHSLKRMISLELRSGGMATALSRLGILLKRWPARFTEFADIFPPLMRTQDGYEAVLGAAGQDVAWRTRLLNHLAGDPQTGPLAYRLLLDLRNSQEPGTQGEVDRVVGLLLARGQPQLAYQAFALSTSPERQAELGYVTNPAFIPTAAASPFDWSVRRLAGVEARMLPGPDGSEGSGGLHVQFRDRPVKGQIAQQVLMLPPGDLEMVAEITTQGLVTPKGLSWTVTCERNRQTLGELVVEPGNHERRSASASIKVPPAGCDMQWLRLSTGVVAPSMRYRYGGSLTVHRLAVRLFDGE